MGNKNKQSFSNQVVDFISTDPYVLSVLRMAEKVASTDVAVLIQGESGTGKEVLARRIHQLSKRADKPMVCLNCGAIQETLLLSELFGHEKGAFTGAVAQKVGLVELANGGTLFLDEIGELGTEAQTKLLRFLQEGEAYRIGGKTPIQVNVRVVSATNRDIPARIREGKFREDLFYRINTVSLQITPLRQRPVDIPALAESFLRSGTQTNVKRFSTEALALMKTHRWPGNVRELQNVVERFKILGETETIGPEDVRKQLRLGHRELLIPEVDDTFELSMIEKRHILRVLSHFEGNKTKAANAMGITVKTLYNKLARYQQEQNSPLN
jgi:transcriptional regulator with PAS, ATPase and Fis domain